MQNTPWNEPDFFADYVLPMAQWAYASTLDLPIAPVKRSLSMNWIYWTRAKLITYFAERKGEASGCVF